ncbi:DNA polymerase/3'-5' exonuclease PolX [Belliella aquatica]|uniref:DNA polymerase/3'-5' exonuclease PolX n=1 Tax=Belliella aquatica TaxID=1323734 RepID=A0ABQ1M4N0_9BACT|nr:DNA polymerase/3'-5' exonuclease PolX [Belliella aquatica]MCH7404770.1 helix-hairpin-helix domain-containing protein [Belliella aquatica]GGC34269.1 DNA polymerase/3'-5' exonuclease PolX [Belliella aquatica]
MELHDENAFKIRSYQSAVNTLERGEDISVEGKSLDELQQIGGIGKSIAEVIFALGTTETHSYLETLLEKTPKGILEILEVKGLGPKKVKVLWEEMNITSVHELLEACQAGQVAKIKGFGEKTQESIIQALEFKASNQGKWLYADIENAVLAVDDKFGKIDGISSKAIVGEFARKLEIINHVEWLFAVSDKEKVMKSLESVSILKQDLKRSSPFKWRGKMTEPEVNVMIHFTDSSSFIKEKILRTGSKAHLLYPMEGNLPFVDILQNFEFTSEEEVYEKAGYVWIPEELREGFIEFDWAKDGAKPLLEKKDLKGILHNHSTYSDGKHTLRQMAENCKSLGYEYLGISDHSRTASYAGGLDIEKVQKQQAEIDQLNIELAPFKVFKGIESDILTDGSLDYPNDVLASFDFIVASIHSGLSMDRKKATARILKAVENPYTTILGHPTGRLLLRREGYPLDHKMIIDACAANGVIIEINANPWRLDLDWRWVHYAIEKGVKLAINPDAHAMEGYDDMRYGVLIGRKGGLTAEMTFNALGKEELNKYFEERKNKIK